MSSISRTAKFQSMTGSAAAGMSGLRAGTVFGRKKKSPRTGGLQARDTDDAVSPNQGPKKIFRRHGRFNTPGGGRLTSRASVRAGRAAAGVPDAPSGGGKTLGPRARSRMKFGRGTRSFR